MSRKYFVSVKSAVLVGGWRLYIHVLVSRKYFVSLWNVPYANAGAWSSSLLAQIRSFTGGRSTNRGRGQCRWEEEGVENGETKWMRYFTCFATHIVSVPFLICCIEHLKNITCRTTHYLDKTTPWQMTHPWCWLTTHCIFIMPTMSWYLAQACWAPHMYSTHGATPLCSQNIGAHLGPNKVVGATFAKATFPGDKVEPNNC